ERPRTRPGTVPVTVATRAAMRVCSPRFPAEKPPANKQVAMGSQLDPSILTPARRSPTCVDFRCCKRVVRRTSRSGWGQSNEMAFEKVRQQIASEAARLMFASQEADYHRAKLKAARQFYGGLVDAANLPTNREVCDEIEVLARQHLEGLTDA